MFFAAPVQEREQRAAIIFRAGLGFRGHVEQRLTRGDERGGELRAQLGAQFFPIGGHGFFQFGQLLQQPRRDGARRDVRTEAAQGTTARAVRHAENREGRARVERE